MEASKPGRRDLVRRVVDHDRQIDTQRSGRSMEATLCLACARGPIQGQRCE